MKPKICWTGDHRIPKFYKENYGILTITSGPPGSLVEQYKKLMGEEDKSGNSNKRVNPE